MNSLSGIISGTFFADLIVKGGPVMYPILLCSVLVVAISLERSWSLRRKKVIPAGTMEEITRAVRSGNRKRAYGICREFPCPMAGIVAAALDNAGKEPEHMRMAIEDAGRHEATYLEKHLSWLATIASIAPLLGLLGTVTGIIKVFNVIQSMGPGNPSSLSGGISEALITTAAGLIVAIPAMVLHNFFAGRVDKLVMEMEKNSLVLMDILTVRHGERGGPEDAVQ